MNARKESTVKDRLTGFLVLFGGAALLLSLFAVSFGLLYSYRYAQAMRKLVVFDQYCDDMDAVADNLRFYLQTEETQYRQTVQELFLSAQENLEELQAMEQSREILREVQDILDMTVYMEQNGDAFLERMEQYQDGEEEMLREANGFYEMTQEVYEVISGEYQQINRLILNRVMVSYQQMQKRSRVIFVLFFALVCAMACYLSRQIRRLSHAISDPVTELIGSAEQIRSGGLEQAACLKLHPDMDRDIRMLMEVFNGMIEQLKRQMETLKETAQVRIALEKSRFKELQMQINPHFLFNTLNMIAEKAYLENADETVELLESAAKMFRFSLDFSGKTITLAREIEGLGDYVFMQEQRFGERIEFFFDLDETFHELKIPALILQPLVENSIVHGLGGQSSPLRIRIVTRYDAAGNEGIISIEDNGTGMSAEKLEEVRREMERGTQPGVKIGLQNVFLRLKLFFGDAASMQVESRQAEGTRVVLRLPCAGEEKGDVSIDYSR